MLGKMPTVRLSTGVLVANFSSPHTFRFTDGSTLEACSPERAKALMLQSREDEHHIDPRWVDIELEFSLSTEVRIALFAADRQAGSEGIDIVIVPLPVLRAAASEEPPGFHRLRTIRVADRVNKINHHDRFCR